MTVLSLLLSSSRNHRLNRSNAVEDLEDLDDSSSTTTTTSDDPSPQAECAIEERDQDASAPSNQDQGASAPSNQAAQDHAFPPEAAHEAQIRGVKRERDVSDDTERTDQAHNKRRQRTFEETARRKFHELTVYLDGGPQEKQKFYHLHASCGGKAPHEFDSYKRAHGQHSN